MKRFFGTIGPKLLAGIKGIDRVGDALDVLPGGKNLVVFIPVVGPALAIALDAVDTAERAITSSKSGPAKLAMALTETQVKLAELGIEEKRLHGIIELALLILKNEALLATIGDQ